MGTGTISLGVKRPGHETDHSPPAIPPLPNTPSWRGAQLRKYRDNFTST
jgi:hypothetical protein